MKKVKCIAVVLYSLLFVTDFSLATNYSTSANGTWTGANWSPGAPPNPINAGDTIFISHNITLNSNATVGGVIIINAAGVLSGAKDLNINGVELFNDGSISIDKLTNSGTVTNNSSIITNDKLDNSGTFNNNASGTVTVNNGKDFDNSNGTMINLGTMTISNDLKNNNGTITNNGTLTVNYNYDNKNGTSTNNGTITVSNDLKNDSNSSNFINNGTATVNNDIKNKDGTLDGTNGSFTVTNNLDNNNGNITGSVNVCKTDGSTNPVINGGSIGPNVTICGVILPMEQISFNAIVVSNAVVILWSTASESNSSHFIIEKSSDANTFEEIGKLKAAGNSSTVRTYTFNDWFPVKGITYYRYKQVNFNNSFTYSNIVFVKIATQDATDFKVYPNPVNAGDAFYIEYNGEKEEETLVVLYDQFGKELYSKLLINKDEGVITAIDVSNKLSTGVYLVVSSNDNEIYKQRLVIK